eukprot:gb/GECH01011929.1/.p1 GENE.gb/GECH01011929.1/~~gb/GECH01011929.1/.p1  ORF type:complete len:575 (+),score=118.40 gb/GECH01011929.1/:1-1725(+)
MRDQGLFVPPHRRESTEDNLPRQETEPDIVQSSVNSSETSSRATSNISAEKVFHSMRRVCERVIYDREIQEAKKYGNYEPLGERDIIRYKDIKVIQGKGNRKIITAFKLNLSGTWRCQNTEDVFQISSTEDTLLLFGSNSDRIQVGFGYLYYFDDEINVKFCVGEVIGPAQDDGIETFHFGVSFDFVELCSEDGKRRWMKEDIKPAFKIDERLLKKSRQKKEQDINGMWESDEAQKDGMNYIQCYRKINSGIALLFEINLIPDPENISSKKWSGHWISFGFVEIQGSKLLGHKTKKPVKLRRISNVYLPYDGMGNKQFSPSTHGKFVWHLMEQNGSGSDMILKHLEGNNYYKINPYIASDSQMNIDHVGSEETQEMAQNFTDSDYDQVYLQQELKEWIYKDDWESVAEKMNDEPDLYEIKIEDQIGMYPKRMRFTMIQLAVHYSSLRVLENLLHRLENAGKLEEALMDKGSFPKFFSLKHVAVISLVSRSLRRIQNGEGEKRLKMLRKIQEIEGTSIIDSEDDTSPKLVLKEALKEDEKAFSKTKIQFQSREKIENMKELLKMKRDFLEQLNQF